VLEEVNSNRKALMMLDASLLERLTSNTGNLLEDEELIGVLANTKAKVRSAIVILGDREGFGDKMGAMPPGWHL
jgi:hypothetical protein